MNDKQQFDADDEVMRLAQALPKELQPETDLWPKIEAAINQERASAERPWPRLFAQAAAVVLLVAASSGLTWLSMQPDEPQGMTAGVSNELNFEPVSGSFGARYVLGPEFQDARDGLLTSLNVELEKLEPETRSEVVRNIETIRTAIREINTALAAQPDSELLQELLINAYREELLILRQVDELTGSVMRRTDI